MQKIKGARQQTPNRLPAIVIAGLVWLLAFLPLLFPDLRLWGFNHLLFLPAWHLIIYTVLGLIALAILAWPDRNLYSGPFNSAAVYLMDKPSHLKWLILALITLPIFWIFRMPTHFLGDGYEVIGNVSGKGVVIYKWAETGAVWLVHQVAGFIPLAGREKGEYAYAIVSAISGTASIFIFFALAYELGKQAVERLFIALLLTFSGWILLFFGYTENYPILWPVIAGYILFSVRFINEKNTILLPTIFMAAAIGLHLQSLFFMVSYPMLLLSRGRGLKFYRRHRRMFFLSGLSAVIVAGAIFVIWYRQSLSFQLHFLPFFEGRPAIPDYALISINHLIDIFNELILLTPLFPVLLVLSWDWWRRGKKDKTGWFLLWLSAGGLVFLFMLDPKLGMARDWDLFALAGLGPLLVLTSGLSGLDDGRRKNGIRCGLVILSAVLIYPFVITNLSYDPSLKYFSWILRNDAYRSQPGIVQLRNFHNKNGDSAVADSLNRELHRLFPRAGQIQRAHDFIRTGRTGECMAIVNQLLKDNPYLGEGYYLRGLVYLNTGQYDRAIEDFDLVRDLSPYDHLVYVNLSIANQETGRLELAMENLRKAQSLQPDDVYVLQACAMMFLNREVADSALSYADRLLVIDSLNPTGLLVAGVSNFKLGRREPAQKYLTRYLTIIPPGGERERIENMLRQLE